MLSSAGSPSAIAIGGKDLDHQHRVREGGLSRRQGRASDRQVWYAHIIRGQQPRHDAGIGDHLANACFFAQMVTDQTAQLVLQKTVDRARRRHRAGLAIDELVSEIVLRIPFEELRDGHPDRNCRRCQLGRRYSMDRPRDTFRGASICEKAPRGPLDRR
jgi:hypothetical protein